MTKPFLQDDLQRRIVLGIVVQRSIYSDILTYLVFDSMINSKAMQNLFQTEIT